jgi:two-component system response regulator TctD
MHCHKPVAAGNGTENNPLKEGGMRILLVEDDDLLVKGLVQALRQRGFAVDHEADGADAAQLAAQEPYSLIVLDVNLPRRSGFDILKQLRARGSDVPVLLLTARDTVHDRVTGLDLGADDYLVKPFALAEFEARVRALVRRGRGRGQPVLSFSGLVLDPSTGMAKLHGRPLLLRRREMAVLSGLMERAGELVPKARLMAEVFGYDEPVAPNAIELYIARLRRKLEPDGPEIHTVRGLGYLLAKT